MSSSSSISAPPTTPILWIYGADAVGKSAVAWDLYTFLVESGHRAAYVDTDYLGFCTPQFEDRTRLVELNLASMWPNFRSAGAEILVVSGIMVTPEHRQRFQSAVGNGRLHATLLTASPAIQRGRVLGRAQAEAQTRGEHISDLRQGELDSYVSSSIQFAELLASDSMADHVLDTDGVPPAELARQVHDHWTRSN